MLLGAESCDIYGTNQIEDYWQARNSTVVVAGAGRCGSGAFFNGSVGAGPWMSVNLGTPFEGWVGWASRILPSSGVLFGPTFTAGIYGGYGHIALVYDSAGALFLQRSFTGLVDVLASTRTANGIISFGTYHAFGMNYRIDPVNGYCRVYLDGFLVIDYVGNTVSTLYPVWTGLHPVTSLRWIPRGYLDDILWGDATGSAPYNSYPGDKRCEGQLCTIDSVRSGTFHEWTLSAGTDQGALLNENPPNDGATEVRANVIGRRVSVRFPDITLGSGDVYAIVGMPNTVKSDSGFRSVQGISVTGGVPAVCGAMTALNQTDYTYRPQGPVMQTDPVTGLPWVVASANAEEFGLIVTG